MDRKLLEGRDPALLLQCYPGSSFQARRAARTQGALADDRFSSVSAGPPTSSSCWTNVRSTGAASSARGAPPTGARATCGPSTSTCTAPGCSYKTRSLGLRLLGKVFFFFFFLKGDGETSCFYFRGKRKKKNYCAILVLFGVDWIPIDGFSLPVSLPTLPRPPRSLDWEVEPCFTVVERGVLTQPTIRSMSLFRKLYFSSPIMKSVIINTFYDF